MSLWGLYKPIDSIEVMCSASCAPYERVALLWRRTWNIFWAFYFIEVTWAGARGDAEGMWVIAREMHFRQLAPFLFFTGFCLTFYRWKLENATEFTARLVKGITWLTSRIVTELHDQFVKIGTGHILAQVNELVAAAQQQNRQLLEDLEAQLAKAVALCGPLPR